MIKIYSLKSHLISLFVTNFSKLVQFAKFHKVSRATFEIHCPFIPQPQHGSIIHDNWKTFSPGVKFTYDRALSFFTRIYFALRYTISRREILKIEKKPAYCH